MKGLGMAIPKKFKHLIETKLQDVEVPDYIWLTYAVCAMERESCGWAGWMIEVAYKKTEEKYPTRTGEKVLPAMMDQVCPRCGRTTFRTAASIQMVPSGEPSRPDVECLPIEYESEEDGGA